MRYPTANFRRVAERVRFRPAPHCGPCARDDGVSSTRADTGDDGDRRTASSAISIGLHACGPVAARVVGTLFACSSSSSTGFMPPVIGKISFLNVMTIGFTTTTVRQNGGQLELQRSHLYRRQRSIFFDTIAMAKDPISDSKQNFGFLSPPKMAFLDTPNRPLLTIHSERAPSLLFSPHFAFKA